MKDVMTELQSFHQGTNYTAYRTLGCHVAEMADGGYRYTFRTWAPKAHHLYVVGEFCGWDTGLPMTRISDGGVWEAVYTAPQPLEGTVYKYRVCSVSGEFLKGDPYAVFSRGGADGASIIRHDRSFPWQDDAWLAHRRKTVTTRDGAYMPCPLLIYEMHLGSFMKHEDGNYLTYREAADRLVPYVKSMGYTHVELMPIAEYPYDRSWGYQVCAFYAPTSRYGTPDDFRYFVDALHSAGIGVILDWVPAHFPKDAWGLYEFDGHPTYEYQVRERQESPSWGTRYFDLGRPEVQSFLISNAAYWLTEYHVDGLRVDAVSSMLYLDYDRKPGEWVPNIYGENKNLEAIAFVRKLNEYVFGIVPDALMIAEESTSWDGITHPVFEGGLGFNLKWNMGWANDFFDYLATDPYFRQYRHQALNFPLMYAYNENYILPISHDEVVYGKKSLIDKCYGSYEDKCLQFKTALLLQMTYPGKKLLFMGTEYAQFAEWDYDRGLEWFMLDYPVHAAMHEYVAALNRFYLAEPALWELDFAREGFEWIYPDAAAENMVAFRRRAMNGDALTVLMTFSGCDRTFRLPAEGDKQYEIVFETDGNGEAKRPLRPYAVQETVRREVPIEPPKPVRKRAKRMQAVPAADAEPHATHRIVEEMREVWYVDVPLRRMSGIVLRGVNGDANKIFL